MIRNLFGLSADGRTDRRGGPSLLQAALLARQVHDTIRFTQPPRVVLIPLFAALAPFARLRGLRGSYAAYETGTGEVVEHLEALPDDITQLPLSPPTDPHL